MSFDAAAETALMSAVSRIAAEEILPRFRALAPADIAAKSAPDDLVTEADKRTEARLADALADILPGATFIGEEAVSERRIHLDALAEADRALVVDPVDGTWNFAHGIGTFGTILAVIEAGETVWGGLYDPLGDDWVSARKGEGAWFRSRDGRTAPIKAAGGPTTLAEAHGYASTFMFSGDDLTGLTAAFPEFRRMGNLRCSAHEYRQLAQGHVDFDLSAQLHVWDHAAGALIVTEAGGTCRLIDGAAYTPLLRSGRMLAARNEALWHAVADRLSFLA